MAKDKGWICLHRKITESPIWMLEEPFGKRDAWIDLLLMVNHEDKNIIIGSHAIVVHKGQKWTSIRKLSEKWHWSKNRVIRYLDLLKNLGMIQYETAENGTLITVKNFSVYQGFSDSKQKKRDTNGYTNETPTDTQADTRARRERTTNNNDKQCNNNDKQLNNRAAPVGGGSWQ